MHPIKLSTGNIRKVEAHPGRLVLDITIGSGGRGPGRVLAPNWDLVMGVKHGRLSWSEYVDGYLALMRDRWVKDQAAWAALVDAIDLYQGGEVVLVCYCVKPDQCHRSLAVDILSKVLKSKGYSVDVGPVR